MPLQYLGVEYFRFLAIFGGMTVVPLGGQTDLLGAGTFWLVNVAARWFLRQDATSPQAARNFSPTQASAGKMQIPALTAANAGICWFCMGVFNELFASHIPELFVWCQPLVGD